MSIGKRLFNLARSELNSLLDRAAEEEKFTGADPDEDLYRRYSLDELSDAELEAEIERRHRARQAKAQEARQASKPTSGSARSSAPPSATRPAPDEELRRAYAALEVPFGADFQTVRSSYRALMRKYHPDRHAGSPDKQKAATEVAQKLTLAYRLIEKRSRKQ
jgi:DnaJ-domain-containing protein 1